jgi:hypothetical protein
MQTRSGTILAVPSGGFVERRSQSFCQAAMLGGQASGKVGTEGCVVLGYAGKLGEPGFAIDLEQGPEPVRR